MALFITCSDSRIIPSLVTQTEPGELFILRNAGNIIPPFGASNGGEAATIEYGISVLGVQDVIICGHSKCGAMSSLLNRQSTEKLPSVALWLQHAEATRRIMLEKYTHLQGNDLLTATVQENVLMQLENLRTHPAVAAAAARGAIRLHGWVYKFETGQVFSFDPHSGEFLPLGLKSEGHSQVESNGNGKASNSEELRLKTPMKVPV
jgi:carbonic anhydrase